MYIPGIILMAVLTEAQSKSNSGNFQSKMKLPLSVIRGPYKRKYMPFTVPHLSEWKISNECIHIHVLNFSIMFYKTARCPSGIQRYGPCNMHQFTNTKIYQTTYCLHLSHSQFGRPSIQCFNFLLHRAISHGNYFNRNPLLVLFTKFMRFFSWK